MAITATFLADFSDFSREVDKAEGELEGFEQTTARTGTSIGSLTSTARQFDSTLAAVGINIGPATRAIAEIEAVAGKSATALGLLGTAGATLSAAVAGWQIGRQIAAALNTDEIIGNAVARWMGWGDLAKETAGAVADAAVYANERTATSTVTLSDLDKSLAAERKRLLAEEEQAWDAATKIRDRFFGDDAISKADQYTKALGMLGGYVDSLSRAQLVELRDAMLQGIDAMARSGRLTDAQSSSFATLAAQADAALAALTPLVAAEEDLAKAQWENALASDAALAGMKKAKDEAEKLNTTLDATKKAAEGAGVALMQITDPGGVSRDLFGRPVVGIPGLTKTYGQPVGGNNFYITQPLGTPDAIARAVGDAMAHNYRSGGNLFPGLMALTGSDKALMYALGGVARGGATRGGYTSGLVFILEDGVSVGFGRASGQPGVIIDSLQITDSLDDTPNRCSYRAHDRVPVAGSELIITLGSRNNLERLFAGSILLVTQRYAADKPENVQADVAAVDYTWQVSFKVVTKRYQSLNAAAIAADLIATYAPGFTGHGLAGNLPVLDEITFTNEEFPDALTRLARRIGAYWYVDYQKDIHLFLTEVRNGAPVALTPTHDSLAHFQSANDRSQILTRVYVEGRGSRLLSAVLVGDTRIPLVSVDMFTAAADLFAKVSPQGSEGGAQHLSYTGVEPGGVGSLVGPGALPPAGPTLVLVLGAGLSQGVYQYAYTFVTALGESLPSPITTTNVGALIAPPSTPLGAIPESYAGGVDAGSYYWTYTYASASGETTGPAGTLASTAAFPLSAPASQLANVVTNISGGGLPAGRTYNYRTTYVGTAGGETTLGSYAWTFSTPGWAGSQNQVTPAAVGPGVARIRIYRMMGFPGSGPYYFVGEAFPGGSIYDGITDAQLVAQPQAPTTNTAQQQSGKVTLSGITAGPSGIVARHIYRTTASGVRRVGTINDNYSTSFVDTLSAAAALGGALLPTTNTAGDEYRQVQLSNLAAGPASVTGRNVYRTLVNGAQLKKLLGGVIVGATTYTDNQSDASISGNLNAPTGDSSGIAMPAGQVAAGSTAMIVANPTVFLTAGGWAVIGNGEQVIRYTGVTSGALSGIPPSGIGAIVAAVAYNSTVTAAPMLIGIPTTGARAILWRLSEGDEIYLVAQVDDVARQAALAAELGTGDGVREVWVQDRRLSYVEARARGSATLALHPLDDRAIAYTARDLRTASGKTVDVALGPPTDVAGTFRVQEVTIGNFRPFANQYPTFTVKASSRLFNFEDLLRRTRRTV